MTTSSRWNGCIAALAAALCLWAAPASAEHTRVTNPNTLGVEGLGKAALYSVFFDRVLNDDLAAGVGFGTVTLSYGSTDISSTIIPMYVNYYFTQDGGSLFLTAGADIVMMDGEASGDAESSLGGFSFSESGVMPVAGLGYESRGDSGFLFRVTGYALFSTKVYPWIGFSFGYSF
ncbi:MAG: hypothetical protein IT285_01265 [Bdellovibrionales bacterium]|nr:hypothetical protein [Bdellovibrionales bacterium]